jgi:hypothetical protein
LLRTALKTAVARVVSFVQPLTEILRNETSAPETLTAILTAVVSMMEENKDTIPEVAKTHFFYVLPVTRDELLDLCIRAALQLFENGTQALNKYVVRTLSALIQKRTTQMLVVSQPIVRHFPSLTDGLEVSDLLLQMKNVVLNIDEGRLALSLIYQLMTTVRGYPAQRGLHALRVFHFFLQSTVPSNVICGYMALANLVAVKSAYSEEEIAPVFQHLANGVFWPSAMILLSRLTEYPITDELVYLLTLRAAESRLANIVLMQISGNPLGGGLILKYRENL